MTDWQRPKGGVGLLLLVSLVLYGVAIGLALSIPIGAVVENWWQGVLIPIIAVLSPMAWLIARYVEDRKDRRELVAPINELSNALVHFQQGIRLYSSALRQILSFEPADRQWKIDALSEMLNTLIRERAAITLSSRIPKRLVDMVTDALDESMENCREAFRRTRGATFLKPDEQTAEIAEAIELASLAADRVHDLNMRLQAEL